MKDKKNFIGLILILLITIIIYLPSLHGDFIFDDFNNIVYNYRILIKDLTPVSIMQVLTCTKGGIRPLAHFSFALNYYFFGINPFYYHLVNLIFHLLNIILVFFVTKKIWERLEGNDKSEIAALVSALFFSTATIQTSAVSYIVQRMALGMTLFSLLSILLFLNKKYFYSFVCIILALGFKENAVLVFPILFFLYWVENGKERKTFLLGLGFFILLALLILSPYGFNLFESFKNGYKIKGFSMWERLLTEPRVIFHYISLIFFPYFKRFAINYNYPLSTSIITPITTLLSIIGIVLLTAFTFICKRKYLSFFSGFFLISLALENTFIPLDIAYEHRMYFPMVAISGIIGYLFVKFEKRKVIPVIIAFLVLFNIVNTFKRNEQYKDYITILKQDIKLYPENTRALYNMYTMTLKQGKKDEAIKYLKLCLKNNPKVYNVYVSYADYLSNTESPEKAIEYLKKILETKNNIDKPHLIMWKIAKLYEKIGDKNNALKWYSNAMKKYPGSIKIRRDFGLFLFNEGKYYYGYLNMAKAYELDNYQPLTVYYLAKMTKILKMNDKFKFFSNFYKLLYQKGRYYNLPAPEF